MKQLITLVTVLVLSFQGIAQDPELYRTWYLHEYLIDPGGYYQIRDVSPNIFPTFIIPESLEFSGIGACNTFTGTMDYDGEYFTITSFLSTNDECVSAPQNYAETDYFSMFEVYNNDLNFTVEENEYGVKFLIVHHPLLSYWLFSSAPLLPMLEIYDTWYLSEMTVDNGESTLVVDINPAISPTMNINADLSFAGQSACNEYMGEFMYHESGDFFTVHNFDATLSICDYDSHNEFETQFFSYFGANADVEYSLGGTFENQTLTLEFTTGNELVFQNIPLLSVNENEFASFTLYPNPTTEELFISSEKHEIESVVIYSVLGKKVNEFNSIEASIDVSNLSEGIYFVEVSTSEGKSVKKFVKK